MVRRLGLNFQGGPGGSITKSSVDRALGGAEAERKRQGSALRSRKPSHGQGHCKDISEAPRSQKGRRREDSARGHLSGDLERSHVGREGPE